MAECAQSGVKMTLWLQGLNYTWSLRYRGQSDPCAAPTPAESDRNRACASTAANGYLRQNLSGRRRRRRDTQLHAHDVLPQVSLGAPSRIERCRHRQLDSIIEPTRTPERSREIWCSSTSRQAVAPNDRQCPSANHATPGPPLHLRSASRRRSIPPVAGVPLAPSATKSVSKTAMRVGKSLNIRTAVTTAT